MRNVLRKLKFRVMGSQPVNLKELEIITRDGNISAEAWRNHIKNLRSS